jgi:hypothetical protein
MFGVEVAKAGVDDDEDYWYCHLCLQRNLNVTKNCKTCGRHESYAQDGYPLPLHGNGSKFFRPSQIINVLEDINEVDDVMWTPLHNACVRNNEEMALKLLELCPELDAANDKGQTALHLATLVGSVTIVRELLRKGADVMCVTKYEKNTPLHMACEGGFRTIADLLVRKGADVTVKNSMERTPFHLAALSGRADIGSILLRAGTDARAQDIHGWNARQLAELRGHRDFQELVVRATMKEKQSVIKELPKAEWHCPLWTDVTETNMMRIREEAAEKERWITTMKEYHIARDRAIAEKKGEEELRRLELREQRRIERIQREREREELAAQILGRNEHLALEESKDSKKSPNKNHRPRPPLSLMGMKEEKKRF